MLSSSSATDWSLAAVLLIGTMHLSGCSALSTASSMRVDVEVYKGPLSKEPEVQFGELCGVLGELGNSLDEYHESLYAVALGLPKSGFISIKEVKKSSADCDPADAGGIATPGNDEKPPRRPIAQCWCDPVWKKRTDAENLSCVILATLHDNSEELRGEVSRFLRRDNGAGVSDSSGLCAGKAFLDRSVSGRQGSDSQMILVQPEARVELTRASELAMKLKLKSMLRAEADAVFRPSSRLVRIMGTAFVNLGSEYSNQIASRADALLKQTEVLARFLPQSVYLRDSQPTEFLNLYVWNRATAPALAQDFFLHPIDSFSSEDAANRVRSIERLFSDTYWSNINTVYASGQGDVSMALVKDDIGNWNLKSFSTDPTELLKAYKQGGLALVKIAASLAAQPSGVSGAQRVLAFANQLALGKQPDGDLAGQEQLIGKIHAFTGERLEQVKRDGGSEEEQLRQANRILQDHAELIDLVAESAVDKSRVPADGTPATMPVPVLR